MIQIKSIHYLCTRTRYVELAPPNPLQHNGGVLFHRTSPKPRGSQQPNAYRNATDFLALMSSRLGYDVYLKLESLQPSQSFKYRGISLFAARAVRDHGSDVLLVMASGGNAGLALAWAGKALGARTKIYIPTAAYEVQPVLTAAGADVVIGGSNYSEALEMPNIYVHKTIMPYLFPHTTIRHYGRDTPQLSTR
ncbi:tryptophan synthase beta subunit-like PLP-dependent enzyme [Rhizoctonia solani]|nr:tryptophan synthase beta subunit-like PLP-dependent enzyme [Rhizoctonia solani]